MRVLQGALEEYIRDITRTALAHIIMNKAADQGRSLSLSQATRTAETILTSDAEDITIRHWDWQFWKRDKIALSFDDEDIRDFKTNLDEITESMSDEMPNLVAETSRALLSRLKSDWKRESHRSRREMSIFRARLYARWQEPVDKITMILAIAREYGGEVNREMRMTISEENEFSVDVLTRSHARACQMTAEIIHLIEGGFSDGALARWRSLHELAVITMFIAQCGENLAKRYIEHNVIESKRAVMEYKRHMSTLGHEDDIDDDEYIEICHSYDNAINTYGSAFGGPYGWADGYLDGLRPNFSNIEKSIDLDHMRPYYRLASHSTPANPKGIYFNLGLAANLDVLLAGPSNTGFADPGQLAANSLVQISTVLFNRKPTFDSVVASHLMSELSRDIAYTFVDVQRRVEANHD